MKRKILVLLLFISALLLVTGCSKKTDSATAKESVTTASGDETTTLTDSTTSETVTAEEEEKVDTSYRVAHALNGYEAPSNELDEDSLPEINSNYSVKEENGVITMTSGNYKLDFINNGGKYELKIKEVSSSEVMFENNTPVSVYLKGSNENITGSYSKATITEYGVRCEAEFTSKAGSTVTIYDMYYFPKEAEDGVFNVRQSTTLTNLASADTGLANEYTFSSSRSNSVEVFIPNNVFKNPSKTSYTYLETYLGMPMMMVRDKVNGYTLSLSRYQPVVTYEDNSYASLTLKTSNESITVSYPAVNGNRMYHAVSEGSRSVYDMSIRAEVTTNYEEASASFYNANFNLQNIRIVDTDIDLVYEDICEDYKTFLQATEQEDDETGKKYTSYGLPWRITIQDGEFGPLTYQSGFIGQQMASAYNMMLYGTMNDDLESLQNGINVIDFWVDGAEFMSVAGVPHIWYDTWADGFRAYPCFLRMAIDTMEGLLDAYRLAYAHGLYKESWENAIYAFGDFLLNYQNDDGSYYRCYNYEGGAFENWDDGIEEPQGDICKSYNKNCTPMAVRFLGKMYEFTEDEAYKEAALKAGDYIYNNLYELGYYQGGTCDGPNNVDKEGGVYAIYAFDTLYMLTKDTKWITCLKQAVAFTMSTVIVISFPVKQSSLKAAIALYSGYTDGLSFISCGSGGVDNYIAYIYYELFRVYIITGEKTYLKQAEFIQENTKSCMNWDGLLDYAYKSLIAEASTISSFSFSSASDGAWVTWSSVANAEPIAKMYTNFGKADVMEYANTPIEELRERLDEIGIGGKEHTVYDTDIYSKLK